ncbi:MAG: CARDB domain-containing protein [Candidatus Promineifilaceae bacterium]
MSVFRFHQTQWQEPQDEEFQMWIQGVNDVSRSGIVCELSSQVQIVVFAGDNQPTSPAHVGTKYRPMMDGIVEASRGLTHTLAVVLGDQTGADNTRIQLVQNGVVSTVVGLPDTTGVLTTTVTEYDMADGAQLGGFLRWTLDNYTDATTNVTLSYYGHGTYLAPAVDMEAAFTPLGEARAALPSAVADVLFPLPYLVDAFPNFTDVYPKKSLITPYALQQMLEIGTRGGQTPIEVLDLTHCFAFSLEEVYELTNDGGTPYAEMIVGSANYAYFASEMVGDVLSVLDPNTDAKTQAIAIVDAYDAAIGEADLVDEDIDVDHPRTFAVVESAVLNTTAGGSSIKMLLDDLSYYLLDEFNADPAATIVKLQAAASATLAYDTSYCKQDWELGNPDALLDAGAFLANIVDQFGLFTRVGLRANQLRNVLENAVVAHTSADGIPWYATPAPSEAWMLDNEDALGISMFANFFGRQLGADYPAEKRLLPWQMRYYTHDTTLNPHPYRLITPDAHNTPTWADLLQRYWEEREQTEGLLIHTEACLTDLPAVKRTGEVTALAVTAPHVGTLFLGYSTPIRATISAETQLINPLVTFNVSLNNQIIFTNTIAAGSLLTGTYQVESSQPFTPTERGHYTFHVTVDSDNRFKEQNETDNFASHIERASPLHPFEIDATVAGHHQWITDSTALLTITSSEAVDDIIVQIYQYQAGDSPNTQLPRLLGHVRVGGLYYIAGGAYSMVTLPESVEPGIVTLHVWGFANDKMTQSAEIVEFNYAPDNMQLAAGSRTYFRFSADVNQTIGLDLDLLNGDVEMRVWEPGNRWTARQLEQSGVMLIEPTFRGRYLVEIESLTASILSRISSTRDGVPNRRAIADVRWVNVQQPTFVDPVMEPVVEPVTAVKLVENDVAAPHMRVWPIALLLLVCLSGWILRRKPMR